MYHLPGGDAAGVAKQATALRPRLPHPLPKARLLLYCYMTGCSLSLLLKSNLNKQYMPMTSSSLDVRRLSSAHSAALQLDLVTFSLLKVA